MSRNDSRRKYPAIPALLAAVALTVAGAVRGAPITFNTALPVPKNEFLVREQFIVNRSGDDPGSLGRDRTAKAAVSVLGYGVSGRLALFGVLPYRDNELKLRGAGGRVTRGASGFGDLRVFGRYTVVQQDAPGRNFRIAPFAGIKAPTGKDDKRDALGVLPPAVQVGSGSWDPLAGVVATWQTLAYQIDVQAGYQVNTEANDFEAGDVARLDGSLQYRLWPRTLGSGLPAFFYGVIEASLVHQQKDRVAGRSDPDSGGTRLFLTPGLQYVTRRWIAETAIQLPLVQELNGDALENDYIARFSLRANF
ncbi:MAG TPA: transporter [Gammaproteobacteria bacterium]|nr:transporter [Gammaproteobacteria bacterium]